MSALVSASVSASALASAGHILVPTISFEPLNGISPNFLDILFGQA